MKTRSRGIQLTRDLAYSAGLDEANRAMRAAGRKAWSEEDYQLAWDTFSRLWPQCVHKITHRECDLCLDAVKTDSCENNKQRDLNCDRDWLQLSAGGKRAGEVSGRRTESA